MHTSNRKTALITGSAKGLGKSMAENLASAGYDVLIHFHKSEEEARILQKELNKKYEIKTELFKADLGKADEVKAMFEFMDSTFQRLDVLINNVGDYLKKNILELEPSEWDYILQSNLNSAFYCSRYAYERMQAHHWGRIINIGFAMVGSIKAESQITPYFIAKTGLLILTKSMAKELAKDHITVNMISPGVLENSISQPIEEIPMGRVAVFGEFNAAVNYLLSPQADYITGVHLEVAGGWRL